MASSRRAGAVVRLGQANRLALGSDSAAEKPAKQNVNNTERVQERAEREGEEGTVAGLWHQLELLQILRSCSALLCL